MTNLLFAPPDLGTVLLLPGSPGGSNKIHDRSPYGNIGTITGATWKRLPSGLWYLSFDGTDDDVNCGSSPILNFQRTDPFSLLFWFKTDTAAQNTAMISKQVNSGNYPGWNVMHQSNKFHIYMKDNSANQIGANIADAPYCDDIWHLGMFSYDGGSVWAGMKIFIDADEKTTAATASNTLADTITHATDLELGQRGTWGHWKGGMALLRIYNRLLSALEIQRHFNQEKHLFGVW